MPETPEQALRRLAFNALTKGLGACEQYLLLSERERIAKAILADVLPEHEKHVREKVAKEIDRVADEEDDGSSWGGGMLRAVAIARGAS